MKLGLDIGTHTARAAYLDANGQPQLVQLVDGSTSIPAMVRQNIQSLEVGPGVARALAGNAETTVYGCTRLMGWAGEIPSQFLTRLPYAVRQVGGEAICNLLYAEVRATDIYGILVRTLVDMAAKSLGQPIDEVILTTPASAEDRFRIQARAAAEAQGLKVQRLINQPAAALMAAKLPETIKLMAVVNCGGGSTEVSIAAREGREIRILATAGDMMLGGDDLAWAVAEGLNRRFQQTDGVDVFAVDDSRLAAMGLWATAKEMLLDLRDKANTELVLDHGGGFGRDLLTTITQVDILTWLQPQLKRLTELCQQALQNSQQTAAQIEAVVLIGDWVELLAVQQTIAQTFQRPMPKLLTYQAALLPVYGAALATAANAATVRDVTPYALGINCYYGDVELFSPIILANTAIPTPPIGDAKAFTEKYYTRSIDQKEVGLTILQYRGERDPNPKSAKPVYPAECETLGQWNFSGLKPPKGKAAVFTVTFAIDGDGILQLYANETATGHHLQAQITRL